MASASVGYPGPQLCKKCGPGVVLHCASRVAHARHSLSWRMPLSATYPHCPYFPEADSRYMYSPLAQDRHSLHAPADPGLTST